MKKLLCLFFFNSLIAFVYSQALKNYRGPLENARPSGISTYQYYEEPETYKRIKTGNFNYIYSGQDNEPGYKITISGKFMNGLKDGTWSYLIQMSDYKNGSEYKTGSITLISNYKNGYADGNWKEVRSIKTREKKYRLGQYYWEPFSVIKNLTINMNFKNGSICGAVNIDDDFAKFKLSGKYSNEGLAEGIWEIKDIAWSQYKDLIYKDGLLYETIFRESNGESSGVSKFHDQYEKYTQFRTMNEFEKEEIGSSIDTICNENCAATSYLSEYFKKLLSYEYFPYSQIGGDLTLSEGFKGGCELRFSSCFSYPKENFGGEHFRFAEQKITQKEYQNALYELSQISLTNLCKGDVKIIQDKINFCKLELAELEKERKMYDEFKKQEYDSLQSFNEHFWKQFKPRQITSTEFKYPKCHPKVRNDNSCVNCLISSEYHLSDLNNEIEKELALIQFNYLEKINKVLNYHKKEKNFGQFLLDIEELRNDYKLIKEIYLNLETINTKEQEIKSLNDLNKKKSVLKKYEVAANEIKLSLYDRNIPLNNRNEKSKILINVSKKIIDIYKNNSEEMENKIKSTNTGYELIELLKN